jgi:flavodoxin
MMKTVIVYYSRSGATRRLADEIAAKTGADVEEIIYTESMSGIIGFVRAGHQSMSQKPAPIKPLKADLGGYDLVVLGSPVWAGKLSAPALSFLSTYKGSIRQLAVFITHADGKNDYDNVFDEVERVSGLKLRSKVSSVTKDIKSGNIQLDAFLENIKE